MNFIPDSVFESQVLGVKVEDVVDPNTDVVGSRFETRRHLNKVDALQKATAMISDKAIMCGSHVVHRELNIRGTVEATMGKNARVDFGYYGIYELPINRLTIHDEKNNFKIIE